VEPVVEPPKRPTRKPASARPSAAKRGASAKPKSKPKSKTKRKPKADTGRRKAMARAALGSVVLVGLLFAFVYPTRTFLDQRSDTSRARAQLELLQTENKRLAQEAKKLQSDSEIERRGRAYGLVKPGERPFVIIPEPTTTLPTGTASPAP